MAPEPKKHGPYIPTKNDKIRSWQKTKSDQNRLEFTKAQREHLMKLHAIEVEDTAIQLRREDELENMRRKAKGLPPID